MEIEQRLATVGKRLRYHQVVAGILAFCLILAVATHLDAQPRQRGSNQAASQPIDARRLNQILTKIEKRLTALEKQRVSHQPAAPAMHQPGPSFGQASLEARVAELEQKVSQQPAAPATNQASSSPDLTTIEARLTALENQTDSSQPAVASAASLTAENLTCRSLSVVDAAGQTVVYLSANTNTGFGGGSVSVLGPEGVTRGKLSVDHNSSGSFSLSSPDGQGKVWAGIAQGAGFIKVKVNNQSHLLSIP